MDEVVRLALAEAAAKLEIGVAELAAQAAGGQVPFTYAEDESLRFRLKDVEFYAFRLPPPRCIGANRAAREGTRPKKPRQGALAAYGVRLHRCDVRLL